MPAGVEHSYPMAVHEVVRSNRRVIDSVMPAGVEHIRASTGPVVQDDSGANVIDSVMPAGVEH